MAGAAFPVPQIGNRSVGVQKDFKRAYMACIPCRKTKAKCEVSDDSPDCVKCRRERKECTYTSERSSKKRNRDSSLSAEPRSGRRSLRFAQNDTPSKVSPQSQQNDPMSPGERLVANTVRGSAGDTESDYDAEVINTVVFSSKDALGLLFKAAAQQDDDDSEQNNTIVTAQAYESPATVMPRGVPAPQNPPSALSTPTKSVLDLWSRYRFVKQGWFSAVEAVTYIDLFFKNLSGLSPITGMFYANYKNHKPLILEEPLLCCTILMISTRYHVLPGPSGNSRSESIHARLWKHCEQLIQRITLGQEKSSIPTCRTLGSIKALLLMTEWHPRSLHFPPDNDTWDVDQILDHSITDDTTEKETKSQPAYWYKEVFEPAKRSDRMSWMFLGLATTLAHELGVFDDPDPEDDVNESITPISRIRIGRLLFLHVSQLSLRLGCTTLLPQTYVMNLTVPPSGSQDAATRDRDTIINQWIEITKLRKTTTEMFFPNKSTMRQLMHSGRYLGLLEYFQPVLSQWYQGFINMKTTTVSTASKQMLFIDYSYVRMYINSIAMQALVERAKTRNTPMTLDHDFVRTENSQDYKFILEVRAASQDVLSTASELAEAGILRYCPVRVFIRITSASIFLLKAIALGTRNSDLQKSLEVLDRCIHALRYSTHDDMHLSSRYGTLIDRHVRRFKRNFRVQPHQSVPLTPRFNSSHDISNNTSNTLQTDHPREGLQSFDDPAIGADLNNSEAVLDDINWNMNDWLAQPFDPSLAPFEMDDNSTTTGFEMGSLDFLWNLPT